MSKVKWEGHAAKWSQYKKLFSLDSNFSLSVIAILVELEERGFQPKIHYGWRSLAQQAEILAAGNSRVSFSFHNAMDANGVPASLAADIIDTRWGWANGTEAQRNSFWQALGEAAKHVNCYWGGDWRHPDVAHVQDVPNSYLDDVKKDTLKNMKNAEQ